MMDDRGRASSTLCIKKGYAWLQEKTTGRKYYVPTNCRTWSCRGCRDRNLAAVRLRIQYGCWMLKASLLITVTYKIGKTSAVRTADVAGRDLARLFTSIGRQNPKLTWFKVPELTKKGQVHFHLVVGGLDGQVPACERRARYDKRWFARSCLCVEHVWARMWFAITGDSWVVDAREVLSPADTASYLGKYLVKGMVHRRALVALGYTRRWSCSRNWPRGELHLLGTTESRWRAQGFIEGYDETLQDLVEAMGDIRVMERVGSASAMEFDKAIKRAVEIKRLKRLIGVK